MAFSKNARGFLSRMNGVHRKNVTELETEAKTVTSFVRQSRFLTSYSIVSRNTHSKLEESRTWSQNAWSQIQRHKSTRNDLVEAIERRIKVIVQWYSFIAISK